jgi:hypothetical protein
MELEHLKSLYNSQFVYKEVSWKNIFSKLLQYKSLGK